MANASTEFQSTNDRKNDIEFLIRSLTARSEKAVLLQEELKLLVSEQEKFDRLVQKLASYMPWYKNQTVDRLYSELGQELKKMNNAFRSRFGENSFSILSNMNIKDLLATSRGKDSHLATLIQEEPAKVCEYLHLLNKAYFVEVNKIERILNHFWSRLVASMQLLLLISVSSFNNLPLKKGQGASTSDDMSFISHTDTESSNGGPDFMPIPHSTYVGNHSVPEMNTSNTNKGNLKSISSSDSIEKKSGQMDTETRPSNGSKKTNLFRAFKNVISSSLESGSKVQNLLSPETVVSNPMLAGNEIPSDSVNEISFTGEIPDGALFLETHPPISDEQAEVVSDNINNMFTHWGGEKEQYVFVNLFDEKISLLLELQNDGNYQVKAQFPAGFAADPNHIEFVFGKVDYRGILPWQNHEIFGNYLMNVNLVNGAATPIEMHGNPSQLPVQENNNSTGCVVLDEASWSYLKNIEDLSGSYVLVLPNSSSDPTTLFAVPNQNGKIQIASITGSEYLDSSPETIFRATEELVDNGVLYEDDHTKYSSFPLIRNEYYKGKFENASAAAEQLNNNLPEVISPGTEISLLMNGILTMNDEGGYISATLGYGSGSCWTVAALDQTLLSLEVQLPDGSRIPLVVYERGDRSTHPHDYLTYGGFDESGVRFSAPGATVYMNQTYDRKLIAEGTKDYTFRVNPALGEHLDGIHIEAIPHEGFINSINIQVTLVEPDMGVLMVQNEFHSAEEIEQAYQSRITE